MASLGRKKGPYAFDSVRIKHRGAIVTTILNSPVFNNILLNLEEIYDYDVAYVPAGYEHRPDLIANVFYGKPNNWWLLMLVNGISDPFEGFLPNQRILIPKIK